MAKRALSTRPAIFRDAITPPRGPSPTPKGSRRFTEARIRLAQMAGREPEHVSDGDVEAFIRRGQRLV